MPMDPKTIKARLKALESNRKNWDSHWQDISELVLPRRSDFVGDRAKGDRRGLKAVDSTAIIANELLAAGLHGMLTNPASKWFSLRITNPKLMKEAGVKTWLEEVERLMYVHLNSSEAGFATSIHELYMDLTAFGTACMFIGETDKAGDLMFSTRHLKECYMAESSDGIIDTIYRKFEFSCRQIVQKWGIDNVSKKVKECFGKEKFDTLFMVVHCVYPRTDADPKLKTPDNMPIASVYMELKEEHILNEGGFEEEPYVAPRWLKASGETYGRGPGMNNLPDIRMLQEMSKTVLRAAQKVVDPPLQAEDDSVLGPVRTVPGGLNFRRAGTKALEPLFTGGNIPIGLDMLQDARSRIRQGFFIDQLQLNQGPQMTATEVLQRTEEKLRLLGPVLGRLQSEMLGLMINRVFGILGRAGKLPQPPQTLIDVDYNIEYVSPLARAQRQIEANSLTRVFEIGAPIFELQPETRHVFNGPETIRWLSDMFGIPTKLLKTEDEVDVLNEEEKEAATRQAELDAIEQGANALGKVQNGA